MAFLVGWAHLTLFQNLITFGIIAAQAMVIGSAMQDLTGLYPMIVARAHRVGFRRIVYRELMQLWFTFVFIAGLLTAFWQGQFLWWLVYAILLMAAMAVFTQKRLDWSVLEFCGLLCLLRLLIQYGLLGW
ncbi:hypothetical protein L248_1195 [Schleiferilactobacillus shenzhenensis LY-73]|uniref:Uncharacterized protein n=1 Tax=Schleiferilactobacillus shenzhenensis LY-73 TaxID=1231336 RepID=U4TW81_9LACO|nr:hypothetical protein L248_1195 [Schleiferilactobacillus shenzhenensis LY-73]